MQIKLQCARSAVQAGLVCGSSLTLVRPNPVCRLMHELTLHSLARTAAASMTSEGNLHPSNPATLNLTLNELTLCTAATHRTITYACTSTPASGTPNLTLLVPAEGYVLCTARQREPQLVAHPKAPLASCLRSTLSVLSGTPTLQLPLPPLLCPQTMGEFSGAHSAQPGEQSCSVRHV